MYSTCTFCHAALGRNEALEHFPVGRRVAFDQARGRLWVVCPNCRQWNLSPLEIRWEAIEEGERLYRDTRLRVSTDQVGLARMPDGTELIRIGEPQRPELAAWRYGTRFERRWRRHALGAGTGAAVLLTYLAAGPLFGVAATAFVSLPMNAYTIARTAHDARRVAGRFRDEQGPVTVNLGHLQSLQMLRDAETDLGWSLQVDAIRGPHPLGRFGRAAAAFSDPKVLLRGEEARAAARQLLPLVNRKGARRRTVAEAVRVLEEVGDVNATFLKAVNAVGRDGFGDPSRKLSALPPELRLALEMASHEDTERRALEGELAKLEAQWREAEEIAAIADELTLPERVTQRLERLLGSR